MILVLRLPHFLTGLNEKKYSIYLLLVYFRGCLGIENIEDRLNFVVTKPQSSEQTVCRTDGTGRPATLKGNFTFF